MNDSVLERIFEEVQGDFSTGGLDFLGRRNKRFCTRVTGDYTRLSVCEVK